MTSRAKTKLKTCELKAAALRSGGCSHVATEPAASGPFGVFGWKGEDSGFRK